MKRIILVSCCVTACLIMGSCTNEEIENPPEITQKTSADDVGGGANGQTKIPPPN